MKTSIKILLGLLLAIFMIPTLFFMAFGIKLKRNGVKPYNEEALWSRVDIGPGRFVKISSPNKELLDCKLKLSDKPHYMVWPNGQGGDDSVDIHQQLDTLFINYIDVNSKASSNEQYHRELEIFVSDWQHLQINGASVTIEAPFGNQYTDKLISMMNSSLEFGRNEQQDQSTSRNSSDSNHLFMSGLNLHSVNSDLTINSNFGVNDLEVNFTNGEFIFREGAALNKLSGFISPATHVDVNGVFLDKWKGTPVK